MRSDLNFSFALPPRRVPSIALSILVRAHSLMSFTSWLWFHGFYRYTVTSHWGGFEITPISRRFRFRIARLVLLRHLSQFYFGSTFECTSVLLLHDVGTTFELICVSLRHHFGNHVYRSSISLRSSLRIQVRIHCHVTLGWDGGKYKPNMLGVST